MRRGGAIRPFFVWVFVAHAIQAISGDLDTGTR